MKGINTVFYLNPPSMNATNIPPLVRGAILTMGIPALTPSVGWTGLVTMMGEGKSYNENYDKASLRDGIPRPNDWPTWTNYGDQWLHSTLEFHDF